jgi:tetratricopeptide (TPR) repeat protein
MGLGRVSLNRGDPESAILFLEESLTLSREVGDQHKVADDLLILGLAELEGGNQTSCEEHFRESLRIAQELDSREGIAANLEGFARLSATQKNNERAAKLFSVAASLRDSLGIPVPPIDQTDLEKRNSDKQDWRELN